MNRNTPAILSLLWLIQVVNLLAIDHMLQEVTVSMFTFIACATAWTALAIRRSISRWISIVVAALFSFIKAASVWESVVGEVVVPFLVNQSWGLVGALLIILYAWKWRYERES